MLRRRCLGLFTAIAMMAASSLSPLAFAAGPGATAARFHDRDCADFGSQRQAQHFYETHDPRRDPHRLDADHDGIACEDLS